MSAQPIAGAAPSAESARRRRLDPAPLRVAAFTGGEHTPGARFRIRQYTDALAHRGIEVREWPARAGAYPPVQRFARPAWAFRNLASRLRDVARARACDVTFLQRELLSTLVTLEPFTRAPRVLDVDDAIWVYGGEAFCRRLAGLCEIVVCGNAFLAEHFTRFHRRVEVIPTVVDTDRFVPDRTASGQPLVIGWSGSSSTVRFLEAIEEPLAILLQRHPEARLRVVSDLAPKLSSLPQSRLEMVPWSVEHEVKAIQGMTVGLMPLDDSVVARGKCSLKMLLYMACGVPAVVSPVGANLDVLAAGEGAIAAASRDQWVEVLDSLLRDASRARAIGALARELVIREYSVARRSDELAAVLRSAAGVAG